MFRVRLGVRTRILAIALIPSLSLLVIGASTAGYLVAEGNKAQEWASQNRNVIPTAREFVAAVQDERQLTLAALGGDEAAVPALGTARLQLDNAFKGLIAGSIGVRAVDDSKIGATAENFLTLDAQLARARTAIDTSQLPIAEAYAFYNRLLDGIVQGSRVIARTAPNAEIAAQLADGVQLFRIDEAMSRSNALAGVLANTDGPTLIPMEDFLRETGFYHTEVISLTGALGPDQKQSLQTLTSSQAWQRLTAMENALVQRNTVGPGNGSSSTTGAPGRQSAPLSFSAEDWHSSAAEVNRGLIDIWLAQNEHAQKLAEGKAADATTKSAWAGGVVVAVSLIAFLIAVVLANRIIRRLRRLRGETLALADERLPDMMRRLGDGEVIDPATESPNLDYGHDEIGEVAKAFQHAHAAAVAGAVNEARTREGVKAVFLNIAHRSQMVVHRQLEILDKAEARQEDPTLLDTLFKLDHLATRERRNAENLIVLGGGQPGRQWRNPVPLIDVVRSAVGETLDYTQVRIARLPATQVLGAAVADVTHLLAELMDNATSFSPPQSRVEVTGTVVGKGVAVEISDQGMGIPPAETARINELLREPPDFGLAALSTDSRLGLFVVAKLAARQDISVRLTESDYGGIRAIVLIPATVLTPGTAAPPVASEPTISARRSRQLMPAADRSGTAMVAESRTRALTATPPAVAPTQPPAQPTFDASQPTEFDGRPALPRRRRQASIAPQLANPAPAEPATEQPRHLARSAEQARDLMSAIENGTRQGRRAVPDTVPPEVA
ncbi:nitrate- and nitrite sensing domain-containing protein, partial [Nocardia vinacea]|uniref:sensor histidine kinase n=1 Tax=Nocardia vinacea TaxID=96468 RepID=UPI003414EFB1